MSFCPVRELSAKDSEIHLPFMCIALDFCESVYGCHSYYFYNLIIFITAFTPDPPECDVNDPLSCDANKKVINN